MTLQNSLLNNPEFQLKGNVFYQSNFETLTSFETDYINLRKKEGRLYSDHQVLTLPDYADKNHPELTNEWKIRKHSAIKLTEHLLNKRSKLILDLGCGNGWLGNLLSTKLPAQVICFDCNEVELMQGASVFKDNPNLVFVYGDIFSTAFSKNLFDSIVVASVIQYFHDIKKIIARLMELIKPAGEIHILDSPLYSNEVESLKAKNRSSEYFQKHNSGMIHFYHHHALTGLQEFKHEVLYNPDSFNNKIIGKLVSQSPFPWISIYKN